MLKKFVFICLLSLICFDMFSQSKENGWKPKVSFTFPWFFDEAIIPAIYELNQVYLLKSLPWYPVGFGFEKIIKEDHLISIGVDGLGFDLGSGKLTKDTNSHLLNGFETQSFKASFYFEFNKEVLKKNKNFRRYIGLGLYPITGYYHSKPLISNDFHVASTYLGTELAVNTTVVLGLSEKTELELSLPMSFMSVRYFYNNIKNPALTVTQQRTYSFNFESFNLFLRPTFAIVF